MNDDEKQVAELSPEAKETLAWLDNLFVHHKPFGDQPTRYGKIRKAAKLFALTILSESPESREQHNALDAIRTAMMWGNSAIACNEKEPATIPPVEGDHVAPARHVNVERQPEAPVPSTAGPAPHDGTGSPVEEEPQAVPA